MKKAYKSLKKYKRAYVVCAVGQSYIDSTDKIVKTITEFSKYPVILYYSNGNVNYTYDNLIIQPFKLEEITSDPSTDQTKLFTTIKAQVTLNCIKRYDVDTVVMLDSDILPTPQIDDIFDKYEDELENYPIFIKYAWNVITIMGRPHVSEYIRNTIQTPPAKIPSICSCMCIANKNCISFLEDWKYWCENKEMIKYHYVDNKEIYYDFSDESIANALLWKYGAEKYIPCDLMWAWKSESVKFALDFYEGKLGELPIHESNPEHYRVPEEFEVPYGLSVLPKSKNDLLGFHGLKDLTHIDNSIEQIKKRF